MTNGCLVLSGPAAAAAPYQMSGRFSQAITELGNASALDPSSFVLRPRALAWLDSCGLISRAVTGLLIFTHWYFSLLMMHGGWWGLGGGGGYG